MKKKKNNFIRELIVHLNVILSKEQKKSAIFILSIMTIGMFFEILLLNNLFILLNYLTNTNIETPRAIGFFTQIFDIKNVPLFVLVLFIISFFVKTVSAIIVKWQEGKFLFTLLAKISEKLLFGYLKLPLIFHQKNNSAKILKNITLEVDQFSFIVYGISTLTLELLVLSGISFYLIFLDPIISLSCITSFIAFGYLFNLFNRKKIKVMGKDRLYHQDERIKSILECLTGLRELKIWLKENSFFKKFELHNNSMREITISQYLRTNLSKPSFEIFLLLMLSIFLIYFLTNNLLNEKIIPMFGLYLAAAYRLVPSIAKIVQSVQHIQFNLACAVNLSNEIKRFKNQREEKENKNIEKKKKFNNLIQFKNLSFSYDSSAEKQNDVLKNINFTIKKGDMIGISGESGSGKSTLIDLLIGLQNPKTGEILVDGININKFLIDWQGLLGCVPQEVFILDDSLKKNIAFGVPEKNISKEKISKCLKLANLDEFVSNLEKKEDTIIGERGARISGGQKQRIGMARAFYNDPEILIFDESTNSLDIETERKILSEIQKFKKEKTIIIISHNNEILKNCDQILNIQ